MQRQDLLDPNAVDALTITDGAVTVTIERDGEHHASSIDKHYTNAVTSRPEGISRNFGGEVVISRTTHDRAAVVATAIEQIFATAQEQERRQALEDYLREEFAEAQRRAIADGEPVDA